jgi:Kef-type K+ transport system membrane component KefB
MLLKVSFALPFQDPVLVFSLILLIILLVPLLLGKLRVPGIIGMILAGVVIGPNGLNLLERNASFILFGTVGLLYIMFTAGLEIDMEDFKKNRRTSVTFGLTSFLLPQILGMAAGYYLLGFGVAASVLLGALLGSHTLLAYPAASKLGIAKSRSVTVTVGGTIIADLLSLLVLAIIASAARGELGAGFWLRLVISLALYAVVVIWGLPRLGRWFFRNVESENVAQYTFVLAVVFVTGFMAELAGLEAIIGAFLAGLVLNQLIPHRSPLMNRIEFVGNAVFIPFFLISVGMLVDVRVLFQGPEAWLVAGTMLGMATVGKWGAAWLTAQFFNFTPTERNVIFGLSNARAAATLTAVLVGFELKVLDESVLNGAVITILVTCIVSSLVTEQAGRKLAITESSKKVDLGEGPSRILVPISNPATLEHLVDFALLLKEPASPHPIYPLAVVKDGPDTETQLVNQNRMLEKAIHHAAAADETVQLVPRIDLNVSSGILRAIRELLITKVVIGWNGTFTTRERVFGSILDNLLEGSYQMLYVCKILHPLNTMNRMVVAAPANAGLEKGFGGWVLDLHRMAKQIGASQVVYADEDTQRQMQAVLARTPVNVERTFRTDPHWTRDVGLINEVTPDDLLVVVSARADTLSYDNALDKMPRQLARKFENVSFVILYPEQKAVE